MFSLLALWIKIGCVSDHHCRKRSENILDFYPTGDLGDVNFFIRISEKSFITTTLCYIVRLTLAVTKHDYSPAEKGIKWSISQWHKGLRNIFQWMHLSNAQKTDFSLKQNLCFLLSPSSCPTLKPQYYPRLHLTGHKY